MWCFLTTLSQSKDGLEFEMCLRPAGPAWQSCPIFQYFFVGAIYHLKKTALIHCQDGSISQYLACEVSHQISQRITQPWQDESFMPGYIFDATSSQPSPKMHWNTWPGTTGPRSSWQNRKKNQKLASRSCPEQKRNRLKKSPETTLQKQVHLDSALQKSRPPPGFWCQSGRNCETTTQDSCKNRSMEQTMLPERFGQCALFFESTTRFKICFNSAI